MGYRFSSVGPGENGRLRSTRSRLSFVDDSELVPALSEAVMYKKSILLVGMVLGGALPTIAQSPQLIHAQGRTTPIVTTAPEPSLRASFLPPETPRKPAAHFNYLFGIVYQPDQHPEGLERLSLRSLSFTQSSPPSLQYWGGRSRYDGTLHIQYVQLGPLSTGGPQDFVPARQTFPGGPFSVAPYGVSLSYHFGRNAHLGHAAQIWRRLGRVVGATR